MGLTVKDKAGTTTTSAISKGTITITDKENQKQDIEKLNRNTEDSLNKLKEIFDKTKVEERKQLLEELGIVGNRAIHELSLIHILRDQMVEMYKQLPNPIPPIEDDYGVHKRWLVYCVTGTREFNRDLKDNEFDLYGEKLVERCV